MASLKTYTTLGDLQQLVDNNTDEHLQLEYKGSLVLGKSDSSAICKAVTAFANSIGGQFILGIEQASKHRPMRLDGGFSGASKLDWIYQIISANTYPAVEGIEVDELIGDSGRYYIITVSPSTHAPHQNSDHKYYKRRGSHSEPMEHYEIEDVRNRPKGGEAPLSLKLVKQNTVAFLKLSNTHTADDILDITFDIKSNINFQSNGFAELMKDGIKRLPAKEELFFVVDAIGMMLRKSPDAQFTVSISYRFHDTRRSETQTFFMSDFKNSAIFPEPIPRALGEIDEQLKALNKSLKDISREIEKLETIGDGTGLRLSQRTLAALKNEDQLFDPHEFDLEGYKQILNVSWEDAGKLWGPFHTIMAPSEAQREYAELPKELRDKFEARFSVKFEDS